MALLFLLGRVIFGIYWLENAYNHLFKSAHMIGYAQSKGVKHPKLAIMGTGVLLAIGGLSMLLGIAPKIGVIALVIFLLGVSFKMHDYWKQQDPMARMTTRIEFMKNMALIGALLMILSISSWTYSLAPFW